MDKENYLGNYLANFDWRTYCKDYNLSSRIDAIKHLSDANKYTTLITRLPQTQLKIKEPPKAAKVTNSVDLRSKFPPCYDQGNLGSCTANAMVGAYQYLVPSFFGSRLFLYYNERVIENSVKYDNGAYIHDGIFSMEKTGLCAETDWPYIISKFAQKPPTQAYTNALKHKVITAYTVTQTISNMKSLLVSGTPFIIGFMCYASFVSKTALATGLIPMPPVNKQDKIIGGHSVLVVAYDDTIQCPGAPPGAWLCRNSWGTNIYGNLKGYFWLPYNYLTNPNLSSDNWYLSTTSN